MQACMHEGDNDKGFILMNFSLIWVLFESASCISFVLTYVWVKCTKLFTFNQVMALGPTFSRLQAFRSNKIQVYGAGWWSLFKQ